MNGGFSVRVGRFITGKSRLGAVRIDPSGVCWSTFDPGDAILPVIPTILASPKVGISLEELEAMYFKVARSEETILARLTTRVEASTHWEELRASGGCGLAPDEHAVASFLIKKGKGPCKLLTDYPTKGAKVRIYGRRSYYESSLSRSEAQSTLRAVGEKDVRNSYIPRDGILRFGEAMTASKEELVDLFVTLGEWCSFRPA
jgi:hypothetical protein